MLGLDFLRSFELPNSLVVRLYPKLVTGIVMPPTPPHTHTAFSRQCTTSFIEAHSQRTAHSFHNLRVASPNATRVTSCFVFWQGRFMHMQVNTAVPAVVRSPVKARRSNFINNQGFEACNDKRLPKTFQHPIVWQARNQFSNKAVQVSRGVPPRTPVARAKAYHESRASLGANLVRIGTATTGRGILSFSQ